MSATEVAAQDEIGRGCWKEKGGPASDGFVLGGAFAKMIGKISKVKKDEAERRQIENEDLIPFLRVP